MNFRGSHPIGGIDYPTTLQEFDEWFSTEKKCLDYVQRVRWPDGFICPICNSRKAWRMKSGLFRCSACQHKVSVIAGTIFQGTRKPLKLWFQAIWYVTSQKFGGSALGLKRILGLNSYQTAWSWLHKMRRAMVRPERSLLSGSVEVDETFIGGKEHGGKRGRGAGKKSIVAIAIEVHEPMGFGRVRMKRIPDVSGDNLIPFVCSSIARGSNVLTDSWRGYNGLEKSGYAHKKVNLSNSGDPAHVSMPGVHRVSSLLKRWLLGTHQGAVSEKHLDYYLDEYTFRFNRRTSTARGLLFYRLLEQAVCEAPTTYREIVRK
jgi:transposase-like protein/ribosomal protein L37AE/L43A